MSECRRFEEEAIALLEQGQPLEGHFESCEDCIAGRASYERLTRALAALEATAVPPDDWQSQVLSQVASARPVKSSGWQWAGAMAASVAAIAALWSLMPGPSELNLGLIGIELHAGDTTYRGEQAALGDSMRITGEVGSSRYVQLRVYRDDAPGRTLCGDPAPCARERGRVSADVTLDALGEYHGVLLYAEAPLPSAQYDLDHDVLLARDAGVEVSVSAPVQVR